MSSPYSRRALSISALGRDQVPRAALVDVDLEVGPPLDQRSARARVVEVDVGEQQRARPLTAERVQQRRQARRRARIDEHVADLPDPITRGRPRCIDVDESHPRRSALRLRAGRVRIVGIQPRQDGRALRVGLASRFARLVGSWSPVASHRPRQRRARRLTLLVRGRAGLGRLIGRSARRGGDRLGPGGLGGDRGHLRGLTRRREPRRGRLGQRQQLTGQRRARPRRSAVARPRSGRSRRRGP